jgi:hypothetical protein
VHYLLFYEFGDDYISKREIRELHLTKAWEDRERCRVYCSLVNPQRWQRGLQARTPTS